MASVIVDNFESYSVAELNGQGSWTGTTGDFEVVSSPVNTGARGVKTTSAGGTNGAFRVFADYVTAGSQIIYLNHDHDSAGVDIKLVILNTTSPTTTDYTLNGSAQIALMREGAGDLQASIATGDNNETNLTDLATGLSFGTWYKLEIEWDASMGLYGQFRGRINDGTWSAWKDTTIGIAFNVLGIGAICLAQNDTAGFTTYFDDLGGITAATTASRRMLKGIGT